MKKKEYPGGVKLTATKARAVAMQEFGTTKGLTKEETAMPGYFKMRLGNLFIRIHPDTYDGTGVALQTSCEKFSYNLQKRNGA